MRRELYVDKRNADAKEAEREKSEIERQKQSLKDEIKNYIQQIGVMSKDAKALKAEMNELRIEATVKENDMINLQKDLDDAKIRLL